jgi:UDP-N-acetyl-D-glucosamine/UDP-N-acetyl-D-galactosamine dehydrogenase
LKNNKIAIIGLGYVGLPLACEFGKYFETVGYDISVERISELLSGFDRTLEISSGDLEKSSHLHFSSNLEDIRDCNIYIITVPTPIYKTNEPDLRPLVSGTKLVAEVLKKHDLVIYESTVFPGCTEEICVPILESVSGLIYNEDFHCGYSPERINPGDQARKLVDIVKVVSGSDVGSLERVAELYRTIIKAGVFCARNIKVAEAAKVIENTQRDINIALINEFSIIFSRLGIDTQEVLDAAATKWNFLKFEPGLVGGHCIGVDPYYLAYKSKSVGYLPEIILAGRRLNDSMSSYIAQNFVKHLTQKNISLHKCRILIMGVTFKENCSDIRNSKVIDLIDELKQYGISSIVVMDPLANPIEMLDEYNLSIESKLDMNKKYDGIIISVPHEYFKLIGIKGIQNLKKENSILFDLKSMFEKQYSDFRL